MVLSNKKYLNNTFLLMLYTKTCRFWSFPSHKNKKQFTPSNTHHWTMLRSQQIKLVNLYKSLVGQITTITAIWHVRHPSKRYEFSISKHTGNSSVIIVKLNLLPLEGQDLSLLLLPFLTGLPGWMQCLLWCLMGKDTSAPASPPSSAKRGKALLWRLWLAVLGP